MEKVTQNPRYESVGWLAKTLGINITQAYQLTRQQGFPAVRISPRRIVVIVDALDAWMQQQAGIQ